MPGLNLTPAAAPAEAPSGGAASTAQSAALLRAARFEAAGSAALRRHSARAAAEYADASQVVQDWATLTGLVSNNVQVSGNKLYANSTQTNPLIAYVPLGRNVTPGERFHLECFFDTAAPAAGSFVYFGISTRDVASAAAPGAAYPDELMLGLSTTSTNNVAAYKGANLTGVTGLPANYPALGTLAAGRYHFTVDGDETSVSFMIRRAGAPTTTSTAGYTVPVAQLAGKTIGHAAVVVGDARGLTGHSASPVIAVVGSQQPPRTKTVAGHAVASVVARDIIRLGTGSDRWRLALPPGYDPRRPAPLAINLHPSASSVVPEGRPWLHTGEVAMSTALAAAGYIVAAPQDGAVANSASGDRFASPRSMQNHADLFAYIRSHFAVSSTVLYGGSMGGQTGLNIIAREVIPNVDAAYFVCPGSDWNPAGFIGGQYDALLRAEYGATSDADLIAKMTPTNSMAREGWEFRGVPIRMVEVLDDPTTPPAVHVDPFLAKIAPYAREASKRTVASGGHMAAAAYDANDLMAFLGRHVA